jgi:hypothetical protein
MEFLQPFHPGFQAFLQGFHPGFHHRSFITGVSSGVSSQAFHHRRFITGVSSGVSTQAFHAVSSGVSWSFMEFLQAFLEGFRQAFHGVLSGVSWGFMSFYRSASPRRLCDEQSGELILLISGRMGTQGAPIPQLEAFRHWVTAPGVAGAAPEFQVHNPSGWTPTSKRKSTG